MAVRIEEFSDEYAGPANRLVIEILTHEFGFTEAAAPQPDLLDIGKHYGAGSSRFWVALEGAELVGTVGFVDLGNGLGLLRKMFVDQRHRGSGTAQLLLDVLLSWARTHRFTQIYLGTNAKFQAAHRFYEKHGFAEVPAEQLPKVIPRIQLRDRFFRRSLR